ncbi:GIY-YIG nuclease family protein [Lyngbya sp. CCAP 1446/10]|uniref:GIY-YIG nuclease family protein n=1 Tax=Microcoleaceae TaxID=1892252 RepID=UPI002237D0E6|nr:GIY-YIG nuclease family protein [Lyngbya sp. CCAP 1446/10]MCW6051240.1 GIY-YIG nuclease family protein [Lyngbya sp. CCAP 1446/10]
MEVNQVNTDGDVAIEHQNVPIAHEGLHNFLYSSDSEHSASTAISEVENDGTQVMSIDTWRALATNAKVAGVYAVIDASGNTQYVGYSRNILLSINGHIAQNGEENCAFLRVQTFKFPKREEMESLRDAWIAELGTIPPGNDVDSEMWASTVGQAARSAMSATEQQAYEEKKLKLRKAMADSTLTKELETAAKIDGERHQHLEAAVNNDDWSAVIQSQTQETKSDE